MTSSIEPSPPHVLLPTLYWVRAISEAWIDPVSLGFRSSARSRHVANELSARKLPALAPLALANTHIDGASPSW